jgi:predicted nucleic acid-binding Zn ribbon protein
MILIEKKCLNCNNVFQESKFNVKKQKKFCSRSCGASFNNKIRKMNPSWKNKISNTLKNRFIKNGSWGNIKEKKKYYCLTCNSPISYKRKTCSSECLLKFKKLNPPINGSGGYRKGSGRGKHGWYDNIYFDSTYELAFYIYCKNKNIEIKRCEDTFEYINIDGNKRIYHPDFRVNGKITEIKGYYTPNVDLKIKSVNEPIDIFYKENLKEIFQFVETYTNLKIKNLYKLYYKHSHPDLNRDDLLEREIC